jgi:hypothetical protein
LQIQVEWVPVLTAAKLLRVRRQRVYTLCSEGKLVSQLIDGVRLVQMASIKRRLDMLADRDRKHAA